MRLGIIIIFHNDEKNIDTKVFLQHLEQTKNTELCLVNNASKDRTYQLLEELRVLSLKNISIVDIKKFKSDSLAVRSGARFMFNQFDLNHIGFVSTSLLNNKTYSINSLIKEVSKNQDVILNYNIKILEKKGTKQTLFKSVFSIIDYLEALKNNSKPIGMQY